MDLFLYDVTDSNNTINKTLLNETRFKIKLKDTTEVQRPTIILKTDKVILNNYAYIPEFERYYFIESISIVNNNITRLELKVDVLESFKNDILSSDGEISKTDSGNPYFDGGDYYSEVRKEFDVYYSDVEFIEEETIVLTTIKGVDDYDIQS